MAWTYHQPPITGLISVMNIVNLFVSLLTIAGADVTHTVSERATGVGMYVCVCGRNAGHQSLRTFISYFCCCSSAPGQVLGLFTLLLSPLLAESSTLSLCGLTPFPLLLLLSTGYLTA